MTKVQQAERVEAITKLREWVTPGDTVYTVCDHVSTSGMSRIIRTVLLQCDDTTAQIRGPREVKANGMRVIDLHPNHAVGLALGLRHGRRHGRTVDGVVVVGCGMDMGFHLVYSLSRTLYPQGFACIGDGCPSNDHSNGDRDYTPGHVVHVDGGYALRQRWL